MKTTHILDLAPSATNRRNSEGSFIELKNGELLFIYSRYNDDHDDGATADLYGLRSCDGGATFSEPFPVLTHGQAQADNVMSTSLLRMENGDIGLFYLAKRRLTQCLMYLVRSADEGQTWSEPVLCSKPCDYNIVNNDRVMRTRSGRLIIPSSHHTALCRPDSRGIMRVYDCSVGDLIFYASDDDGRTWYTLADGIFVPKSRGCVIGVDEPGVLELENGTLWCFFRNDSCRQYECFSEDNGKTWSPPLPSPFTSAISPMSAKTLRDGRILVLYNPIPLYNGRSQMVNGVWTGGRNPLAYALSTDGGQTFSAPVAVEDDPNHGFCYATIHETDDGILLAYCAGGPGDAACLDRLRITKLYLD